MSAESIPPTQQAMAEALALTAEILANLELGQLPLSNIALKTSRVARLLNDFDMLKILEYEISGYPTTASGVAPEVWKLAQKAGRGFVQTQIITKQKSERIYLESIDSLEDTIRTTEAALAAARDPENPRPGRMFMGTELAPGNSVERGVRLSASQQAAQRLASRRNLIYQYAQRKHYELKFSGIADDVFSRTRERVDATIGEVLPDAVRRFTAVYDNLRSENPEDWSNAVHSCRRILTDLADAVFLPTNEPREVKTESGVRSVKLGKENYINRILAFVEDRSSSERFQDVVGSHINFVAKRIESIVLAVNKGTHDVVTKEEAERYVVYTYLLVGDILSLL
jgi:AbiTii